MATPHNDAKVGEIAKTVLMPGDPLRAKVIADKYLEDVHQFNDVRNMFGFTGKYKGKDVSVMGSGMGMPSIGIYSYELYDQYGVDNIIRVGTAGGINKDLQVGDVIIAQGACTDSAWASQYHFKGSFAPIASWNLLKIAALKADALAINYQVGNVLSSDVFYGKYPEDTLRWAEYGVLGVEMESAALYMNAANLHKNALGIFTVSDNLVTGVAASADERQNSFTKMMEVALETALEI